MDSEPLPAASTPVVAMPRPRHLLDARGRQYEPAVSPRLKIVLMFIFACVAVLGASAVYLIAVRLMNWLRAPQTFTSPFTLWMFLVHVVVGVGLIAPFVFFGLAHMVAARHRKNRVAVRLGMLVFAMGIAVAISGLALIQLAGLPQLPTGTGRTVILVVHCLAPLLAAVLYVLHRRAGPDIQWKWGIGWGLAVGLFVAVMGAMHFQDPRQWYARGSPEGEKYFEPSKTRTVNGNFISETALMMDSYCLKCHADVYKGWLHSAHHFSSFNNPPYLFSVRETRQVALKRDGNMRASRWCAGCHDPVPFLSGQFDNPAFDDVNHPTSQAGITCTVCHAMVNVNSTMGNGDYTIEEPQHYPFAFSDNALLQWLNNQVVKAKPDFHKKTFLKPFHRSAEFCSTCHKVSLPIELNHYKEFLRGQNHYDTFLLSGASGVGARSFYYPPDAKTRCAACHMPLQASADFGSQDFDGSGERKIHSHRFPGANTGLPYLLSLQPGHQADADALSKAAQGQAAFLRGTDPEGKDKKVRIDIFGLKEGGSITGPLIAPLRPTLPVLKPGKTYLVEVVIRTLALGHPFPQGTADSNEIWVDFTARSAGKVIGRSGALTGNDTGRVDEWSHFVNVLMLDRHGKRINRRNPQDIFTPLYDHQIPPGAAQLVHYRLHVPDASRGPVELKVRLRYRKFDFEYMSLVFGGDDKAPTLPIVDICEDQITLPVENEPATVPEQSSPIKPAWQRWNDYGIGCFLEGGADAKRGELRQAESAFRELLKQDAREAHSHAFLNLARVYQADGRLDDAVDALNKARNADPPAPWWTIAWLTGMVNVENVHLDEAIASFEQVLDPAHQLRDRHFDFTRDYEVINQLGKALFKRSQMELDNRSERDRYLQRAAEQFERTLALDPENVDAHFWLEQCYSRLGKESQRQEMDGEAGHGNAESLLNLGKVLADDKQPRLKRLQAALELAQGVADFGNSPTDIHQPKLPVLQALTNLALPVYRQKSDAALTAASALVLGRLHREAHAIYKPDYAARGQAVNLYRKEHPAAAHASQALIIYSLNRPGAPGLEN